MNCPCCQKPFTPFEVKYNCRICTACAARGITRRQPPMHEQQREKDAADFASRIDGDRAWLKDARQHDRDQRAVKVVGPESLEFVADGDGL